MPYPTTARGLLGHFLHGGDPPATDQSDAPLPVQFSNIFVLMGNIGCQGWGKGRAGQGERPQDPEGQRGWRQLSRRKEQRRRRCGERCNQGSKEEDGSNDDDGGTGARVTE